MNPQVNKWPDEVLRMCLEVSEAPAITGLLKELAEGSSKLLLIDMRQALAMGDYAAASRYDAMAQAWESMVPRIQELADEWRIRTRNL